MRAAAEVPLLMIAFNRPEKTRRVFEAVTAAAPRRLYLAADGPRADVPSDRQRCEQTRRVLEDVTWPCEVTRLYQSDNLGCKRGVGAAIDWFLAHEESGVILEDDCLPTPDFFRFCAELLDLYRDAPEVMMIGGHNPLGTWDRSLSDYLFSRRTTPIWGWATWAGMAAVRPGDDPMGTAAGPRTGPVENAADRIPGHPAAVRQRLRGPARHLGLRLGVRDADQWWRLRDAGPQSDRQHRVRQRGHPHPPPVRPRGRRPHVADPVPAAAPVLDHRGRRLRACAVQEPLPARPSPRRRAPLPRPGPGASGDVPTDDRGHPCLALRPAGCGPQNAWRRTSDAGERASRCRPPTRPTRNALRSRDVTDFDRRRRRSRPAPSKRMATERHRCDALACGCGRGCCQPVIAGQRRSADSRGALAAAGR